MRDGKVDCFSQSAPYNCASQGFYGGTFLQANFGNDCTPITDDQRTIQFRLYTPQGGSQSDWCADKVTIEASDGAHHKNFINWSPLVVGQGDYWREHSATSSWLNDNIDCSGSIGHRVCRRID